MRQALLLLCSALTAAAQGTIQITTNDASSSQSTTSRLIPILVGGSSLSFTPNSVTARPGDVLQFQFAAKNHSVTQSADASSPCKPVDADNGGTVNGVHSGFILFDGGSSGMVGTFDVPVKDTNPMYLYCAQATHCQSGMVMAVNADSNSLINYANTAAKQSSNTPAKLVSGGVVAAIPIADSIVQASASGGGAANSQTRTVTQGSGGTATVIASATQSTKGGGTATAIATVVVGPSGRVTSGANAAAAPTNKPDGANNPQAQVSKSDAAGRRAHGGGELGSLLVAAGTAALGSIVLTVRL